MMGNGFGMAGMWLLGLLLLAGVVLLVVVAVRAFGGGTNRSSRPERPPTSGDRAREVLDDRYARGELDTDEYRERLGSLGDG